MSEINKLTTTILWVLAAAYAVALVANITFGLGIPIAVVLLISVAFALIHGAVRYGWTGILAFVVICLVVSNVLENTSILTGFPFGHYHSSAFLTVAVPFIAALVMVMWDLTFDPRASTIQHQWIWEQAGGYFGVPLTNYLGWFFTVYLFLQLFALLVRFRPGSETVTKFPRSHFAQAVLMYAVMGVTPVLTFVVGGSNTPVADATGVVWQTRTITESMATVSIFTMLFAVAMSAVKLLQVGANVPNTSDVRLNAPTLAEITRSR